MAIAINHIGLVVRNWDVSRPFYVDLLGFTPHPVHRTWLMANPTFSVHIIEIPEAANDDSLYHENNHVAVQISDLQQIRNQLRAQHVEHFQMDMQGNIKTLAADDNDLSFGIGTVFVRDPYGNLFEFLQAGRGLFTEETLKPVERLAAPTNVGFQVTGVAHSCLVTTDTQGMRNFYEAALGFPKDTTTDYRNLIATGQVNDSCEQANVNAEPHWFHDLNHVALKVDNLKNVRDRLIKATARPFQMTEDGERKNVVSLSDNLEYGLRSIFVYDPDGNLLEFIQD